jgi:hypothetical protein
VPTGGRLGGRVAKGGGGCVERARERKIADIRNDAGLTWLRELTLAARERGVQSGSEREGGSSKCRQALVLSIIHRELV